jgi:hypothetical protein
MCSVLTRHNSNAVKQVSLVTVKHTRCIVCACLNVRVGSQVCDLSTTRCCAASVGVYACVSACNTSVATTTGTSAAMTTSSSGAVNSTTQMLLMSAPSSGLSGGAIAGIVIGCIAAVVSDVHCACAITNEKLPQALIVVGAYFGYQFMQKRAQERYVEHIDAAQAAVAKQTEP